MKFSSTGGWISHPSPVYLHFHLPMVGYHGTFPMGIIPIHQKTDIKVIWNCDIYRMGQGHGDGVKSKKHLLTSRQE